MMRWVLKVLWKKEKGKFEQQLQLHNHQAASPAEEDHVIWLKTQVQLLKGPCDESVCKGAIKIMCLTDFTGRITSFWLMKAATYLQLDTLYTLHLFQSGGHAG